MIMPIDIDKKEFSRDKRGYNSREVDEFLDMIVVDYEKVLNDNRSMAHRIKKLEKELEDAQQTDTAMIETLQTAKKLMSDISASAERRAEVMIRDAELESENILMDAKVSIKRLTEEHKMLVSKIDRLKTNYKRLLTAGLEDLEKDTFNLLSDMEVEDILEKEKKEEPVAPPSKTLVIKNEDASGNDDKDDNEFPDMSPADSIQATISDLSESLKKMAEDEDASMNDTIILK